MKHFTRCMLLLFCTFIFLLITTQINEAARDRVADTPVCGPVEDQPPTVDPDAVDGFIYGKAMWFNDFISP